MKVSKGILLLVSIIIMMIAFTSFGKVTLSFWVWGPGDLASKAVAYYNKTSTTTVVKVRGIVSTSYDAALQTAMQGGEGPDLMLARPNPVTAEYAKAGMFLRVDNLISRIKDFPKVLVDSVSYRGKLYAVPSAIQTLQIYYNKDIFEEYNLKVPHTWAELMNIAKTLKSHGITPFFATGKEGWALNIIPEVIGATYLGPNYIKELIDGKKSFTDSRFVGLLKLINSLKPYFQKNFMASSYADQARAFAFGKVAMVFDGAWMPIYYLQNNPNLKMGVFPCPPFKEGNKSYIYIYSDGGIAVNAHSKHVKEAVDFLKWFSSVKGNEIWSKTLGIIPSNPKVKVDPKSEPYVYMMKELLDNYALPYTFDYGSPFDAGKPSITSILIPGLQGMLDGQITPEQLAQQIQKGVQQWYKPFQK